VSSYTDAGLLIFMAMKIPVVVFWVITPCGDVARGCQRFWGSPSSQKGRQHGPQKLQYPTTTLYGVI